ncbi:Outer membrane protein beta-barrel domain-containing protein [Vibrio xiamenensis]|uniref:Outer membrane protein beta-barrel domain-containing protein n=1 Tax=Vibrio xiamenensis TaxID=861298 RepID=A0A1G8FFH3_9VIBR|nr:OmpA family protein [Vibrio xiamenensis]SDH80894.1 Outer membrane protein beta-barrel domain-containing protein [Vibrio xiamenensis]
MKRTLLTSLILLSPFSFANSVTDTIYVGLEMGSTTNFGECTAECDNKGYAFGFKLGYELTLNVNLEASYFRPSDANHRDGSLEDTFKTHVYDFGVAFRTTPRNGVGAFVRPGLYHAEINSEQSVLADGNVTGWSLEAGGYVRFEKSELTLSYRYFNDEDISYGVGSNESGNVLVGFKYFFNIGNQPSKLTRNIKSKPRPTTDFYPNESTVVTESIYEISDANGSQLFDSGAFALRDTEQLNRLLNLINKLNIESIEIIGHTDSIGSEPDNLLLSEKRAQQVSLFLIANGIDSNLITSNGVGETQPVADNTTPEGRQQNRRVEIKVLHY